MLVNKLGVDAFTADVMQTFFSASIFNQINYVYYDLNNSALDFLI